MLWRTLTEAVQLLAIIPTSAIPFNVLPSPTQSLTVMLFPDSFFINLGKFLIFFKLALRDLQNSALELLLKKAISSCLLSMTSTLERGHLNICLKHLDPTTEEHLFKMLNKLSPSLVLFQLPAVEPLSWDLL